MYYVTKFEAIPTDLVLNEDFDCHKIPGCGIGTVGYHVDDGKIFEGGYPEVGREIEGMGYFDCRSRIYSNFYGGFVPLQSLLVLLEVK